MSGFSEQGTPDDWDVAIGRVTGFRWWQLVIPFRAMPDYSWAACLAHDDLGFFRSFPGAFGDVSRDSAPARLVPEGAPYLLGMYQQAWGPQDDDGWMQAECRAMRIQDPVLGLVPVFGGPEHEPPGDRPCGCGIWAYWEPEHPDTHALATLARESPYSTDLVIPVLGAIQGAGRVVISTRGFRCSRARVTAAAPVLLAPPEGRGHTRWLQFGMPPPSWLTTRGSTLDAVAGRLEITPEAVRALITAKLKQAVPGAGMFTHAASLLAAVEPDAHYGPASCGRARGRTVLERWRWPALGSAGYLDWLDCA